VVKSTDLSPYSMQTWWMKGLAGRLNQLFYLSNKFFYTAKELILVLKELI